MFGLSRRACFDVGDVQCAGDRSGLVHRADDFAFGDVQVLYRQIGADGLYVLWFGCDEYDVGLQIANQLAVQLRGVGRECAGLFKIRDHALNYDDLCVACCSVVGDDDVFHQLVAVAAGE